MSFCEWSTRAPGGFRPPFPSSGLSRGQKREESGLNSPPPLNLTAVDDGGVHLLQPQTQAAAPRWKVTCTAPGEQAAACAWDSVWSCSQKGQYGKCSDHPLCEQANCACAGSCLSSQDCAQAQLYCSWRGGWSIFRTAPFRSRAKLSLCSLCRAPVDGSRLHRHPEQVSLGRGRQEWLNSSALPYSLRPWMTENVCWTSACNRDPLFWCFSWFILWREPWHPPSHCHYV